MKNKNSGLLSKVLMALFTVAFLSCRSKPEQGIIKGPRRLTFETSAGGLDNTIVLSRGNRGYLNSMAILPQPP